MDARTFLPGIAEPLPPGESVRWQGGADPRAVARHVFHQRAAAAYLGVAVALVGLRAAAALPLSDALRVVAFPALVSLLLLGALEVLSRATARHATFVITDRRVVLQVGAAFPIAVNIPLSAVAQADIRRFRDGSGEVQLTLVPEARVAWSALWPFVHPFRLTAPRPMLRGLRAPEVVGTALREAAMADAAREGGAPLALGPADRAPSALSLSPQAAS